MHPRVWSGDPWATFLLEPIDQLCMVPQFAAPKEVETTNTD